MDRPPKMLSSALRIVVVGSAVCLASGYVIFAQVNAQRQSKTTLTMTAASRYSAFPGSDGVVENSLFPFGRHSGDRSPAATTILPENGLSITTPRVRPESEFAAPAYLAMSSKSGSVVREADSALIALTILGGLGPAARELLAPPVSPVYLATSSKSESLAREAEYDAIASRLFAPPSAVPPKLAQPASGDLFPIFSTDSNPFMPPIPVFVPPPSTVFIPPRTEIFVGGRDWEEFLYKSRLRP